MAYLIAPPSSVQPMTKEDVAVVQAEKRIDAATREQLVKVYGDSREPHSHPIDLTRPPHQSWKCLSCGKVSNDIRHVCGYCLHPEPGYINQLPHQSAKGEGASPNERPITVEVKPDNSNLRRAGTSHDAGIQLLQIPSTKRTYRFFTEPHVPTAASHSKAVQHAVEAARLGDEVYVKEGDEDESDAVQDDDTNCGANEQSCQAGGGGGGGRASSHSDGDGAEVDGLPVVTPKAERRAPKEETMDGGFTHFVSIPLGKLPAITANASRMLEDLRSFVEANANADGNEDKVHGGGDGSRSETTTTATTSNEKSAATPDIVTTTPRLHITLLMLTLSNREDIEFAKELLQGPFAAAWAAVKEKAVTVLKNNCGSKSSSTAAASVPTLLLSGDTSLAPAHRHPLIRLGGGLQVMKAGKDNELYHPQKASVVYMGIDDPAALATVQQLQKVLHDSFAELIHDLDEAERSRRVLHATIMNKKWRKTRGARRPFDARPILDAFQEAAIGAGDDGRQLFEIPEVELCSIRRQDADTSTYFAEASVKI